MEFRPIFSALLRSKTGPLLVALQVAISLAILVNALFLVQQRLVAAARPSGIADETSTFRISSWAVKKLDYNDNLAQQKIETAALKAIPGVVSVAWTTQMPMTNGGSTSSIALDPKQVQPSAEPSVYVSPDSLVTTLGLKLVQGRDFTADEIVEIDTSSETRKFPRSVITTQKLAKHLFPNEDNVIGKSIYFGTGDNAQDSKIVGVVEILQSHGAQMSERGEFSLIQPVRLNNSYSMYAVRTEPGQHDRVIGEAEAALRRVALTPRQFKIDTVAGDRVKRYRNERALAWMLIAVSVLLLLVTASGVVGMTTLRVAQRRKQIGVRRALGARKIDILRLFISENLIVTSAGVATGLVLAVAFNQLQVSQLELPKLPVPYLLFGAVLFLLLGIAAVYGPAWRAAGISPATATRSA